MDEWNSLPRKVVEARDVEQFKAELDEAWEDMGEILDKCSIVENHFTSFCDYV